MTGVQWIEVLLRHLVLAALLLFTACGYIPGKQPATGAADCSSVPASSAVPQGPGSLGYYEPGGYPLLVTDQTGTGTYSGLHTWKWSCDRWVHLLGGVGMEMPVGSMAYEPHLRKVVGFYKGKFKGWDGQAWVDLGEKSAEMVGQLYLAFDQERDVLVMLASASDVANTWNLVKDTWTKVGTTGPLSVPISAFGSTMAYDPRTKAPILFGGECSGRRCDGHETWVSDGKGWKLLHPSTAPPHGKGWMVFNVATNQLILLASDHTAWNWTGTNWEDLRMLGPQAEPYGDLVYDKGHEQLLLWAGNQTWIYKAGKWSRAGLPAPVSPSSPASSTRTSPPPDVTPPPVASEAPIPSPPAPAGFPCRIPYADISEASGGFISIPDGQRQNDPSATVALPGNELGRPGQNPGLTYIAASNKWVPVPIRWLSSSGVTYAYQGAGDRIRAVKVADGSSTDVTADGGWMLLGLTDSGVYLTKLSSPGAWFVPYGGAPRLVIDHGRWDTYRQGILWGWDASSNLVRFDLANRSEATWGQRVNGWIAGFDGSNQPFVIVMGVLWLARSDGSYTLIFGTGDHDHYVGGPVVTDGHGSWFSVGGGRPGTPGHGFYLWTQAGGAKLISAQDLIIAGACS